MPPKKKDKESSHEFPIKIAQAIEKYCQNNPNTYAKDQKAYEFAVYTTLDKKFYETNEWKPYEDNGKQKALGYIGNYISKYIPEYQKQSLLNQLLPEEQRVQQLLQVHKDHNKHTESVPAKNSREIGEQILALDAMSRFFSKTPYSSLVYKVGEKSTLYLGVNSDKKDIFLQKINEKIFDKNPNVQDIATAFKNYIQEQNHQNIQKLLQCLQTDVNPILGNILKVLAIKPNTKIISLSEKDQKIIIIE